MAYNEIQDAGKGVDKPKGLVKQAIWGLAFALTSVCGFCVKLLLVIDKNNTQYNIAVQTALKDAAAREAKLQQDYNTKLENRLNRLEHVEERVDKVLPEPKKEKK